MPSTPRSTTPSSSPPRASLARGAMGRGPLPARRHRRRLGPSRPSRHRARPGAHRPRLGARVATRRTGLVLRVALAAHALVYRALDGRERPDAAREACLAAVALARRTPRPARPADPRAFARHRGRGGPPLRRGPRALPGPSSRAPSDDRPARRAPGRRRSGPAARGVRLRQLGRRTGPADSPLAILPVVAHAERYRVLAAAGIESADPAASGHWVGRRARQVMKAAFDWWLEWEREDHPRRHVDLNFLAHAKYCEGRGAEAAALFHRIGPYATPAPWSYPDRDPYPAFRTACAWAPVRCDGPRRNDPKVRSPDPKGQPRDDDRQFEHEQTGRRRRRRHQHLQGAGARAACRPARHGGTAAVGAGGDRAPHWWSRVSCPPHSA